MKQNNWIEPIIIGAVTGITYYEFKSIVFAIAACGICIVVSEYLKYLRMLTRTATFNQSYTEAYVKAVAEQQQGATEAKHPPTFH